MATEARVTAVIEAQDKASGVLNSITSGFQNFSVSGLAAGAAISAVATGFTMFVSASIKAAATMEQTQVAFTTMLGSADKANTLIKNLIDFAKTTPFELSGLNESTKQLLAYGIAQEDIIPTLKNLGNIAAGVGMDKLPNLILAFGQVKAATRLTGMELRQFTEAGVPLLDMLSQQFKKPVRDIQDMVSAGQIGFPAVQQALASLSGEGGRFSGLMEKQSHTLNGAISNLKDSWNIFLTGAGKNFLDWAKEVVLLGSTILQWVNDLGTNMNTLTRQIDEHTGLITLFKYQWDRIVTTFRENLLPALNDLWVALQPLMPFFKALGTVIGATLVGAIVLLTDTITLAVQGFTEILAIGIKVESFWVNNLGKAFDFVVDKLSTLINNIKQAVEWMGKLSFSSMGSAISNTAKSAVSSVGNLLSFDTGGVVPGPVGAPQLAIVHGGETVIPTKGGNGGITVNITGNSISSELDMRDLARKVGDEIMRSLRQMQQI